MFDFDQPLLIAGLLLGMSSSFHCFGMCSGLAVSLNLAVASNAGSATPDHLLVFDIPEADAWQVAAEQLRVAGFALVPDFNPYWDRDGATFEDPDGYRVVLQRGVWS